MEFEHIIEPASGSKISIDSSGKLIVPDNPIIPFIEGDGIGSDITPAMMKVVDSAVEKSYGSKKKIEYLSPAALNFHNFEVCRHNLSPLEGYSYQLLEYFP